MPKKYDVKNSWRWNLENPPNLDEIEFPAVPEFASSHQFLGRHVLSPLGVPAGPLLSADWLIYYARLGFDILTYKTVRSSARSCYPLPNLIPVSCDDLASAGTNVHATSRMKKDWAVSFGMPSVEPTIWRDDVRKARDGLSDGQLLIVSVVGDAGECPSGDPIDALADDYAQCAAWAIESGADMVEANFSCPNVCSSDGQLYQNPAQARQVAETIRQAIRHVPLILKIGFVESAQNALELLNAVDGIADALCMTNAISATVTDASGDTMFDGQRRGICGNSILAASVNQVRMFSDLISRNHHNIQLSAVGGVFTIDDVNEYLAAGATAISMATAAMIDPLTAIRIKEAW